MKLNTPRWWYTSDTRHGAVARTLLKPLSWIWAVATARRIARAEPVDPGIPIISVGNLTVGGSARPPSPARRSACCMRPGSMPTACRAAMADRCVSRRRSTPPSTPPPTSATSP